VISIVEKSEQVHPPERLWQFFAEDVNELYPRWHREHLRWRWLSARSLEPGAVWFADEWVGRRRISGRFVVDEAEPGRFFY
jgi:hypothetical protein